MFTSFTTSESGAVTVDWVVLTAGLVGLGLATMSVVSTGVQDTSGDVSTQLGAVTISTSFAASGGAQSVDILSEWGRVEANTNEFANQVAAEIANGHGDAALQWQISEDGFSTLNGYVASLAADPGSVDPSALHQELYERGVWLQVASDTGLEGGRSLETVEAEYAAAVDTYLAVTGG